jgi:hypothetical protein
VLRALEEKPELRYQQVSEVKTMVEAIVSSGSTAVPPPEPSWIHAVFGPLLKSIVGNMGVPPAEPGIATSRTTALEKRWPVQTDSPASWII